MNSKCEGQYGQPYGNPGSPLETFRGRNTHSSNDDIGTLGTDLRWEDHFDIDFESTVGKSGKSQRTERQRYHDENTMPYPSTPCPNSSSRFNAGTFNSGQTKPDLFPNHQSALHTPPSTYRGPRSPAISNQNLPSQQSTNFNTKRFKSDLFEMRSEFHTFVNQSIQNLLEKLPTCSEHGNDEHGDNIDGLGELMDWQQDSCVVILQVGEVRECMDPEGECGGGEQADDCEGMGRMFPMAMGNPEMRRQASSEGSHVYGFQEPCV